MTISSGDEVVINTVSGGPQNLPGPGFHVPQELLDLHAAGLPTMPGHILTGPVAVQGAMPGDVLQIDILDVSLRQDWGFNYLGPLKGTLPQDFPNVHHTIIPLDTERGIATLPWGLELKLAPFFGVMGVAPPPTWGRISTIEPRVHGGNIDNKGIGGRHNAVSASSNGRPRCSRAATGTARKGDGEVCVTAIETALQGRFRLSVLKDRKLIYPQAETPTHYITMGMDADLDRCVEMALRDMITLVSRRALDQPRKTPICCVALRVICASHRLLTAKKGVHMMMAKKLVDQF